MKKQFMHIAIEEARKGMENNEGGPFGAVIVQNGRVIARAHNQVIKTNDPTAHAEIEAIRKASSKLGRFDLSDCEIYSTCEPCPMCMGAIHWAKMRTLYFGCTKEDAEKIHFDDKTIFDAISGSTKNQRVKIIQIERKACLPLFKAWEVKEDKVQY